jgi:hypothetical protein
MWIEATKDTYLFRSVMLLEPSVVDPDPHRFGFPRSVFGIRIRIQEQKNFYNLHINLIHKAFVPTGM